MRQFAITVESTKNELWIIAVEPDSISNGTYSTIVERSGHGVPPEPPRSQWNDQSLDLAVARALDLAHQMYSRGYWQNRVPMYASFGTRR